MPETKPSDASSGLNKSNGTPKKSQPLSLKEKVCFGLGDVAHGLAVSSTGFWFMYYLTEVAGLQPWHAGLALMIGRVWDAVTDPLMGWITDHTRSRFGKRRPYLLFGVFPYVGAFFALWVVPELGDNVAVFAYVLVSILVFNTFFTVVFVPYTTLTASITQDYNERTALTGYRMFSSQSAFLIGATLPPVLGLMITGVAEKDASRLSETGLSILQSANSFFASSGINSLFGTWAGTNRQAFFITASLFSIIMMASVLTTFFGTRERCSEAASDTKSGRQTPFSYANSILQELQGNRPFRLSALILLITNCASTLVAVNLSYYLEYVVDMKPLLASIIFTLFVSAIIAMPFWVVCAKRFGKAETYRGAMMCYVFVLCCLAFLQPNQESFAYGIAMLAGFFNAASLMLPWAIIPDVIEYDELKGGRRREGLFYGGTTFCYKAATGLALFFQGLIMSFVGFTPNAEQSVETLLTMRMLIGPAPAVLIIIAALLSKRYPLTRERHAKILEELSARS